MTIYVGPVCRNKTHRSCPNRIFACTMASQVARLHAAFFIHSLLYYVDVGALCRPKKGGVGWSTAQGSCKDTLVVSRHAISACTVTVQVARLHAAFLTHS